MFRKTKNKWTDRLTEKIYCIFIDCRISVSYLCLNLYLILRVCFSWVTLWLFDVLIWSTLFLLYFVNLWHDFEIKDWNSCCSFFIKRFSVHLTVLGHLNKTLTVILYKTLVSMYSLYIDLYLFYVFYFYGTNKELFWRMLMAIFSQLERQPGKHF